jgi:hypothetical protein
MKKSNLESKGIRKQFRWMSYHPTLDIYIYIYMKSLRVGQMTMLPLQLKRRYIPLRGNMVRTWIFSSGGHAFVAVRVLPTQAP